MLVRSPQQVPGDRLADSIQRAVEYDPSSPESQHVLVHELAHVRQQTGGAVSMLPQPGELRIDPDEHLEREAEETAERVLRGGELGVQRFS